MRAFTYARQSEDLAEGIDRQQERTRQLAEQRGYQIVGRYADNDVSASKSRAKAQWTDMLRALRDGDADVVIGVDVDRLLRSQRDMLDLMDTGVAVLTVDGQLDLTSADGRFRAGLAAILAEFEVKRKSERQLRANAYRVHEGRPPMQRRRYGYETDTRTPRDAEAAVVRRVFAGVAAGRSLRSLAAELNDEGLTTAQGKSWQPVRLREMVLRPYEGGFTHRGETVATADVVPLVDANTAAQARAVLADPTRTTTPGPAVKHMASGLIECGECGGRMVYMTTYRCKADASHPSIIKSTLEPIIAREVARAVATYTGEVREAGQRGDVRALVAEHEALEAKAAAVLSDRDEGLVTAAVARAHLADLQVRREDVEQRLERARQSSSALAALHDLAMELRGPGRGRPGVVDEVAEHFRELPLDDQRELVRQLLKVTVNKGRGAGRVDVEHLEARWLNPWEYEGTEDD